MAGPHVQWPGVSSPGASLAPNALGLAHLETVGHGLGACQNQNQNPHRPCAATGSGRVENCSKGGRRGRMSPLLKPPPPHFGGTGLHGTDMGTKNQEK